MNDYDRRLSKVQLRKAYELAEQAKLDAAGFQVHEVKGDEKCLVTEFRHAEARAFFRFDWDVSYRTGFSLTWWPTLDGNNPSLNAESWDEALRYFQVWLALVKAETETPDVWTIARQQREWLTSSEGAFKANTPFTKPEQEQIAHHLRTIEEYTIKTYRLQEAEATHVREQLAYLADAATRVGRFDWKNLASSTFIQIVLTLGLDPDKTQKLLGLATQLLGPLVLGAMRLLGG